MLPKYHTQEDVPVSGRCILPTNQSMNPRFLLSGVRVKQVSATQKVVDPFMVLNGCHLNQHAYYLHQEGVADFYAAHGAMVEFAPLPGVVRNEVELFLNGSVLGAILHQRRTLVLHGSSFSLNGRGVLLCGESGSGKSLMTALFCQSGARLISDDVSPICFSGGIPELNSLGDRIKIGEDALPLLGLTRSELSEVSPGMGKFYQQVPVQGDRTVPLDRIYILEYTNDPHMVSVEAIGKDAFTALRNQVYRWQYLTAMPETEAAYLQQLLMLARLVRVIRIYRPMTLSCEKLKNFLTMEMRKSG